MSVYASIKSDATNRHKRKRASVVKLIYGVREKNTRRNLNNSGQASKRQASEHLMPCPQARHIKTNKRASRRNNMKKHKITDWTITAIVERPDGTWYDHTITDFPEHIGITINEWLQDYKTTEEAGNEEI